ncbi:MAG: hypothetical protein ACKO7W_02030 [Elainella sp.]
MGELKKLAVLGSIYPWLFHASLYATWLVAWWSLGAPPRPSWDDPANIGAIGLPSLITGLLFAGAPLALLITLSCLLLLGFLLFRRKRLDFRYLNLWGLVILLWGAAILLLVWDPLRVWYWYLD